MTGLSPNLFFFLPSSDSCHSSSKLRGASSAGLPPGWDRRPGVFTEEQFGVSFQQKRVGLLGAGNAADPPAYILIGLILGDHRAIVSGASRVVASLFI